ncbi:MAG TPA: cobyric acid synthase CobQ, partial [Thermococcus litoralis]|nr:cobyric acid synthase CobQ [Thermococcus litoralis]
VFAETKRTNHLKAEILWEPVRGLNVEGYEIRMGRSVSKKPFSIIREINGTKAFEPEGAVGERVFGTYLHGIFHNFEFTEQFLNMLRLEKGLEPITVQKWSIEEEIERFAKIVEKSIDINYILRSLGL